MRLCYLCDEYPLATAKFGGIGVAFQAEAEWFAAKGHQVSVVCPTSALAPGLSRHNAVDVHLVSRSSVPKLCAIIDRLRAWQHVRRVLAIGPQLAVCADYSGPLLTKSRFCPLVVQLHGCATLNAANQGCRVRATMGFFERRTISVAAGVRAVSRYAAERTLALLRIHKEPVAVIPNAVNTSLFSPQPQVVCPSRILFVGKLSLLKGVTALAQVMPAVFETIPQTELIMVGQDTGNGTYSVKERFLALIPLKHHPRIRFAGRLSRSEVAAEMRRAGVFVLPSYTEAFPMVVIEAMASGIPVVASNRGGIPEAVQDGHTGFLADPDAPCTFTQAILRLLQNHELARRLGSAARAEVELRYTPEVVFGRLEEFYRGVIGTGRKV